MFGLIAAGYAFLIVLVALLIYRLLDLELQISAYRDAMAQISKDMDDLDTLKSQIYEEICNN